ncbi:MAG TPA: DNRLRE domain-containing protein, partial [Candidatus Paceibacterota bacterium]|nr:DNRLRE domain-containing protein [Candidatus Paceibacterota bacterium]
AWFKRVSTTNDDFLFYIGNSDGFGSPDEFQVYGPSGQSSLALRHYIATTTTDADLSVAGVIPNQWYHAAVTFRATSGNTGEIAFYLNGNLAGSDSSVTLNMVSGSSAVFGGHMSSAFAVTRWFNGLIDDAAIFRGALSAQEISRLISLPAAYLGGARATNTVFLNVLPPNHPPAFASPTNLTTIAGAQLWWPVPATDPDSPPQRLTFTLLSAPPGATIDPGSGVISWRPAVAQAGTTGVFQVVATEAGWLTNLAPEADAYVRDGSYASLNFGSDPLLTVKLGASGLARESYLRFPAPLMPGSLAEAVLQLTPVATNFPAVHLLGVVTNDTWSEAELTWNNRPASSTVLAGWTAHAGVPLQVPLTSLYAQEQVSDGLISLRIYATNATSDGRVDYASRENSPALAPRLMVTSTNWSALGATQTFLVSVLAPKPPSLVPAGIHNGAFHLRVSGDAGPDYTIQVSTNLLQWTPLLTTNPLTVPFTIADPISTNWPARFYRALLGP